MFFHKDIGYALYIKIEINSVFFYVLDVNESNSLNDYISRHGLQDKNFELIILLALFWKHIFIG